MDRCGLDNMNQTERQLPFHRYSLLFERIDRSNVHMDAGGKRCLPSWMLKRSAPEELQSSGNGESQFPFQDQAPFQDSLQKMKATAIEGRKESLRQEAKILDENPGPLCRPGTRKRSRRSSCLDVNPKTTSYNKSDLGRKKASERKAAHDQGAVQERSGCENLKQTINESRPENDVDLDALFLNRSEDDVGLTVDDLVSIAEEIVNADEEKQHWLKANEKSKSEDPSSSVFSKNNFVVLSGAAQSCPQISKCTTTTCSSRLSVTDMVESVPLSISRIGDAAEVMLDLFLGPLLRISTERKHERS